MLSLTLCSLLLRKYKRQNVQCIYPQNPYWTPKTSAAEGIGKNNHGNLKFRLLNKKKQESSFHYLIGS